MYKFKLKKYFHTLLQTSYTPEISLKLTNRPFSITKAYGAQLVNFFTSRAWGIFKVKEPCLLEKYVAATAI